MPKPTRTIELPEDFQAFAEERVREGKNASVAEVAREAFQEKKLDEGIAELDAGLGTGGTTEEFMAKICAELGITR